MSSLTTLARPYAKAAFQLARADSALQGWDDMLSLAAAIVDEEAVERLITSPEVKASEALALLTDAAGERFDDRFKGYLSVLADNGRLTLLGEVHRIYARLRREAEQRLAARVVSAVELNEEQRERMRQALSKRYDAEIELENEVDPEVIGGAIIYAGDEVIDGSLRGRLKKLEQSLAS